MAAKDLGPLDWRTPIVDTNGRPSPEFQRRWNSQRFNNGLIGFVGTGDGPPTDPPTGNGQVYVDITSTPNLLYVGIDTTTWDTVGPVNFVDLADVAHDYVGNGNFLVQVDATEDGLIFTSISEILDLIGSDQGDILYRDSSGWQVLSPGTGGFVLQTNGPGANPSWVAQSGGGSGGTSLPLVNGASPPTAIGDTLGQMIAVPLGGSKAATIVTEYLAAGLAAAMPGTVNVPSGASALYFQTDTVKMFIWNGSSFISF